MVAGFIASQPLGIRLGRHLMHLGEVLSALGLAGFVLTLHLAGDGITIWSMAPALAVMGIGMGLTMAPFFDIALAGVDEAESGSASGVLTAVQQLGGAFGVAVIGTMFFHVLAGAGATSRVGAFRAAASASMWLAVGFVALSFALTFLLPMRAREESPAGH